MKYTKEQIETIIQQIYLSSYKNDGGDDMVNVWVVEHEFDKLFYEGKTLQVDN